MEFVFFKFCFSICLLMSSKGLARELFSDAAGGYNQHATNSGGRNAYDMYRQVHKDESFNTSFVSKDDANSDTTSIGGVWSNRTDGGQNGAGSYGVETNGGFRKASRQNCSIRKESKEVDANTAVGEKNNEEQASVPNIFQKVNAKTSSTSKLHALVQHIYAAQARVQLEASEIKKAEAVASAAQKSLEEASNSVRVITATLHTAQQEVAAAAVRAQTAQLQLAAHDQLLFAARQKVDALSAQMVGLQAEDGIFMPNNGLNVQGLYNQLREPLPLSQTPTPIPPVDNPPTIHARPRELRNPDSGSTKSKGEMDYEDFYPEVN